MKIDPSKAFDAIASMAVLLTRERRVVLDHQESDATMRITTVGREYGRICGLSGQSIRDLATIGMAIGGVSVKLDPSDDSVDRDNDQHPTVIQLLHTVMGLIVRHEPEITRGPDGVTVVAPTIEDHPLRASIERIFFAIGRTQNERCKIEWSPSIEQMS